MNRFTLCLLDDPSFIALQSIIAMQSFTILLLDISPLGLLTSHIIILAIKAFSIVAPVMELRLA